MEKPIKTPSELDRMIHDRLYRLEEVQDDMAANPRLEPKVTALGWHERDAKGRNWNLVSVNSAAAPYRFWIDEIVGYLRWKYDIAPPLRQAAVAAETATISRW